LAAQAGGQRGDRAAAQLRHPARPDGRRPVGARQRDGRSGARRPDRGLRGGDRGTATGGARDFRAARCRGLQTSRDRRAAAHHERDVEAAAAPGAHANAAIFERVMTMHEEYTDQLSDYLDGELSADESAALEAHLRQRAACTTVLNDLKRVVARARGLEPRPPRADLWPAIAARTDRIAQPRRSTWLGAALSRSNERRVSLTLLQLSAAAVLLMAVSAAVALKFAVPSKTVDAPD